ncbi:hypothetical protein PAPYR_10371 [Paratrimastix pyriformis]|uniref:Uncharacterized protein n=1 Tax=Paratrimastix pyriformis TaxID=342808 RepID=A0ABQ8U7U3_9EUKA|nr:hypothetical protein PAPYR_10371 [Paratrimastix pyriformis]
MVKGAMCLCSCLAQLRSRIRAASLAVPSPTSATMISNHPLASVPSGGASASPALSQQHSVHHSGVYQGVHPGSSPGTPTFSGTPVGFGEAQITGWQLVEVVEAVRALQTKWKHSYFTADNPTPLPDISLITFFVDNLGLNITVCRRLNSCMFVQCLGMSILSTGAAGARLIKEGAGWIGQFFGSVLRVVKEEAERPGTPTGGSPIDLATVSFPDLAAAPHPAPRPASRPTSRTHADITRGTIRIPHIDIPHVDITRGTIRIPHIGIPHIGIPHIDVPHIGIPHIDITRGTIRIPHTGIRGWLFPLPHETGFWDPSQHHQQAASTLVQQPPRSGWSGMMPGEDAAMTMTMTSHLAPGSGDSLPGYTTVDSQAQQQHHRPVLVGTTALVRPSTPNNSQGVVPNDPRQRRGATPNDAASRTGNDDDDDEDFDQLEALGY